MRPDIIKHLPPRARKWLLRLSIAFVIYSLMGFFLLPPIIKWQMVKQLPVITKRQTAVQQVRVNPWTLSITVRGLSLTEADGRPFASWDELYVNFQASSLFRWAWTFKEIRLVKPFGEVILFKDGRLNLANMLAEGSATTPSPQSRSIPRLNIFHLEITNGFVAFEDRTRRSPFRTEYRPINLNLLGFSTRPNSETPYSFRAESDAGSSLTWAGDFTVQPLQSSGHLEVTGFKLSRYQPYLEGITSALITNGLADAQFSYRFSLGTNGPDLVVTNAAVQVAQVTVLDPATKETIAGFHGFDVRQAELDLRHRAVRLGEVKVSEALLLARLNSSGTLNLLDLMETSAAGTNASSVAVSTAAASPSWNVTVADFAIEKTSVNFEDLTRHTPFKTELKPIEVSIKNLSTQPDSEGNYSFHVTSEAQEIFEGTGTISLNPMRSRGEIKIGAVDVKKYLPYAEDFFRGKIVAGNIDAQIPYRMALTTNHLSAGVTNLAVKLTDLGVQLPESAETVTHVAEVAFERVDASLEDQRGRVGLFRSRGGSVLVRRQKDGTLNLFGLLAVSKTNTPPASIETPAAATSHSAYALGGWILNLDELQLDDYNVRVEDLVPAKPGLFLLDQLVLNVKGASTASNSPVTAALSFRLNQTGTVSGQGTAKIDPLYADMEMGVTNLDLRAAQPYIEPFAALGIVSGDLTTSGKVRFQTSDSSAPQLAFSGSLRVTNLVTTDQTVFKEFVRWEDLTVSGIDVSLAPNQLKIDQVRLVRPKTSLLIGTDRRPNLSLILKTPAQATNGPAASIAAGESATNSFADQFSMQLGSLTLDQASLAFTDESVEPSVLLGVEQVSGTIKGLSSDRKSTAEVDLQGRVDEQSPFSITGRVNPFPAGRFVDLTITNANTQLTPLTGYLEKFGGYPLRKGRLNTSLHYRVEGKALQAENKVQVDQLTLGARNNSPDATKLPLKLGVALLRDSNGRIELDVPVKGRLDDPEFSLGPIVLKIVVNMIVKAATSPFKLLGALAGGGGDELSFVEFQPGTTNVLEGETNKLAKLTTALAKRPSLNVEIEGNADPRLDREALARLKLAERLQAQRLQELAARGRAPESASTFQIEPAERDRLLAIAFIEQFGTNIAAIIQTNMARLTASNQVASASTRVRAKPNPGLWQHITGIFKGGSTGATKAQKRLPKADRQALSLATPELMEDLLAERISITDEDFHQLMTARARWVQDWLVETGQVSAERILLVAPKAVEANAPGQSRVTLSLD